MFDTQEICGNNNQQIIIGKQRAKNITNQFRPTEEQMETLVAALKRSMEAEFNVLHEDVISSVDQVLQLTVNKSIVGFYKDKCASGDTIKQLSFTVADLQLNSQKITKKIDNILASNDNQKTELEKLREEIISSIVALCNLCEDILYNVKLVRKQCEANGIYIKEIKELLTNYIKAAELRNKELLSAIRISAQAGKDEILPTHLATDKIAEMFAAIKEIKERVDRGDKITNVVKEYNYNLKVQINEMSDNIKNIDRKADDILRAVAQSEMRIRADIQKIGQEIADCKSEIADLKAANVNGKIDKETEKRIKDYEVKIAEWQGMLENANNKLLEVLSKGAISHMSCPYCGYKPAKARMVVGGYCRCENCGKQFIDLSPDVSNVTDEKAKKDLFALLDETPKQTESEEQIKRAEEWKKRHTAKLEHVSPNVHSGLYRMQLDEYTVSSNGILIIPNKTYDGKEAISEISFCQPNTDDTEGQQRLKQVKTVILSPGVRFGEYNGEEPFKGITRIEWDENFCSKNKIGDIA